MCLYLSYQLEHWTAWPLNIEHWTNEWNERQKGVQKFKESPPQTIFFFLFQSARQSQTISEMAWQLGVIPPTCLGRGIPPKQLGGNSPQTNDFFVWGEFPPNKWGGIPPNKWGGFPPIAKPSQRLSEIVWRFETRRKKQWVALKPSATHCDSQHLLL